MHPTLFIPALVLALPLLLRAESEPGIANDVPKDAAIVLGTAEVSVDEMQFSADGAVLAYHDAVRYIGVVRVVDLANGRLRFAAAVERKSVSRFALSADGKRLAGGWGD